MRNSRETKSLEDLRRRLLDGDFEFSRHAFRRAVERNIGESEIREAGFNATVIENYPDDKYSPSVLLLGFTNGGRPLHMQVSLTASPSVRIITLYEPDGAEWLDYEKRR